MPVDAPELQIPLFGTPEQMPPVAAPAQHVKPPASPPSPSAAEPKRKPAKKRPGVKGKPKVSGLVPRGDVRLTANIREDLHLKLKIVAARRRTTIGDLIEELVERHLSEK